jgi:hypothetical protein
MEKSRLGKRIQTTSFIKYFTLKVSPTELPDNYIRTILALWGKSENLEEDIKHTFTELKQHSKISEFLSKLLRIFLAEISTNIAMSLINFIYQNMNIFSVEGDENIGGSEYDKAVYLILGLIDEKVKESEIEKAIESVVFNTSDMHLAVRIVLHCKSDRGGDIYNIYKSAEFNKLTKALSEQLKKHFIDEKNDIFTEILKDSFLILLIYQWATNWDTMPNNKNVVNDYLISIVRDDINKFVRLLKQFEQTGHSKNIIFDLDTFGKVCDIKEFKIIAEEFLSGQQLLDDNKKIINMFLDRVKLKKAKVVYYEPIGTDFDNIALKRDWKVCRKENDLTTVNNYDILILFLHEETGKRMHEGLPEPWQEAVKNYVHEGGFLIAFHDVLFSRNKILSENLCGHFRALLIKDAEIEVNVKEKHPINENISNFRVSDEEWSGINPSVGSGELLTILFSTPKDQPLIWLREYGKGEILVISLGHKKELINNENIRKIIDNAIKYFSEKKDIYL